MRLKTINYNQAAKTYDHTRTALAVGDATSIGICGFGGAAHNICQIAQHQGRKVFAFTRPGDPEAQQFALSLGAVWAGDSLSQPPELLDAAIIFASDGALVPQALSSVVPGGVVICGGIHMSDIPAIPTVFYGRKGQSVRWRT